MEFKKLTEISAFCSVSDGNKKIHSNDEVRTLIWNLPAIRTCPYATELCKKFCYAVKAEKMYPQVLPSRNRNLDFSKTAEFTEVMIAYIKLVQEKENKGKKRRILFRIHESGDFYNKEYAEKWIAIAKSCPNVTFYAYTKSIVYFNPSELPSNFVVRASIWEDTAEDLKKQSFDNFPIYTAYEKPVVDDLVRNHNWTECECKDCATCGKCYDRNEKNIACVIH